MLRRLNLSARVTLFATFGVELVWLAAVALMLSVLWSEGDELFDQQLAETAHVLLPLLSQLEAVYGAGQGARPILDAPLFDRDEAFIYQLFGSDGWVLDQSGPDSGVTLPAPSGTGFARTADYRIYTTPFNAAGQALQLAAPMAERREAFRESMTAFLLPMLVILPLTWLLVGWIVRRSLAPMRELRQEIAQRDGNCLDMIDASNWPEDLMKIAGTLNGFMARLTQVLGAERAFATNAAHELRTPVAIALAQVQQMQAAGDIAGDGRLDALERALQRMRRLVARLLQLARADAGVGFSDQGHDLIALTRLVVADTVPRTATARIHLDLPDGPVFARIDPDAFAIILGNLIDNALQHGAQTHDIRVSVTPEPVLEVANAGPVVHSLDTLMRRFHRRDSGGFGLGLHICRQIVEQAGGRLDLCAPIPGQHDGFMVRVSFRGAD